MKLENVNTTQVFLGDASTWSAVQVELNDVQAMWGGRRIIVAGTRHVVVQLVQPGMWERRYELELSAAAWRQLLGVFIEYDLDWGAGRAHLTLGRSRRAALRPSLACPRRAAKSREE